MELTILRQQTIYYRDGDADPKYLRAMRLMSGFLGALPNFQVHQHPQAFQIKIKSHWSWFYLREQ
ncbi:unnamed protein product, partial [Rotaria magnacalcarata]